MALDYPVLLTPDDNGTLLVTCPDLPEVATFGSDKDDALRHAIRHSGQSIAFNVAVFSAGFLVLLFSDYMPIVYLGGLVALALLISGVMSLFLISLLAPVCIRRPGQTSR